MRIPVDITNAQFAEFLRKSERTVQAALRNLANVGLIERAEAQSAEGDGRVYRLITVKAPCGEWA